MEPEARFDFKAKIAQALKDRQLRTNLKSAMDGLRQKRLAVFADPQEPCGSRARPFAPGH